jgi:hypothetical protein
MKPKIIAGATASRVYARMNGIQRFWSYESYFVRNNIYNHFWGSFLGIFSLIPLTKEGQGLTGRGKVFEGLRKTPRPWVMPANYCSP